MGKIYNPPTVTEIGSINEAVNADMVSLISDGVTIPGDMVLITLTKSDM
jgi:hypothetical protein